MSILALLDISSAHYTIDRSILVHCLLTDFGFTDSVLHWIPSYPSHLPGGDNLVKGVQCYELFGGIALKNHTFSLSD